MFANQTMTQSATHMTAPQNYMMQQYAAPQHMLFPQQYWPQPFWQHIYYAAHPIYHPVADYQVYPNQPVCQLVPASNRRPLPKRKKKIIRIRDPNQGCKDVTKKILYGELSNGNFDPLNNPLALEDSQCHPEQAFCQEPASNYGHLLKKKKKIIQIQDPKQEGKDVTKEILYGQCCSRNPTCPVRCPSLPPTYSKIEIQDPNQGGKDVTEEIFYGQYSKRNPACPMGCPSLPISSKFQDSNQGDKDVTEEILYGQCSNRNPACPVSSPSPPSTSSKEAPEMELKNPVKNFSPVLATTEEILLVTEEAEHEPVINDADVNTEVESSNGIPVVTLEGHSFMDKEAQEVAVKAPVQKSPILAPTEQHILLVTGETTEQEPLSNDAEVNIEVERSNSISVVTDEEHSLMNKETLEPLTCDAEVNIEVQNINRLSVITLEEHSLLEKEALDVAVKAPVLNTSPVLVTTKQQILLVTEKTTEQQSLTNDAEDIIEVESSMSVLEDHILLDKEKPEAQETVVESSSNISAKQQVSLATSKEESKTQELMSAEDSIEPDSRNRSVVATLKKGRRQYDRQFLLSLRFICMKKPGGLPHLPEVVLDKPENDEQYSNLYINEDMQLMRVENSWRSTLNSGGEPNIYESQKTQPENDVQQHPNVSVNEDVQLKRAENSWRSISGNGAKDYESQKTQPAYNVRQHPNVFINEDVQLQSVENPWRPTFNSGSGAKDYENQTYQLFRKMQSILNKLTPENFQKLQKQVLSLPINSEEHMKGIVELVYEKAIDEPHFAEVYGNLCSSLAKINVSRLNKPNLTLGFRTVLLDHCQAEFNKLSLEDSDLLKKEQELEAASASEQELLWEELEEAKVRARKRAVNNMKFIGTIFKLGMLTKAIIHRCIVQMLEKPNELNLECLCKLLTTIGKELDDNDKPKMDQYFMKMEKMLKEKKTCARIHFMLQDVIDLRLNNWVPRRAVQGPKTIQEVHEEALMEEEEKERKVFEQMQNKWSPDFHRPSARSQKCSTNMRLLFSTAASTSHTSQHTGYSRSLSSRGSITRKDIYCFEPTWLQCKKDLQEERCKDQLVSNTVFLEKQEQLAQSGGNHHEPIKDKEIAADKPAFSEEQMEKCCKSIIEEFLNINDYKEAVQCVDELQQPSMLFIFVRVGVDTTLEKSQITRNYIGQLFHQLLDTGSMSTAQFIKGFMEIFEVAEDLATDIPHLWSYLAELITPVLSNGGILLKELFREFRKHLKPLGCAGKLFCKILYLLCKDMGQRKVETLWRESGLSWSFLLSETEDVESLIAEHNLEFTLQKKR